MEREVVIIGAGVLGVSLAFHLSKLGIPVLVLERESVPAAHASGKNAGMVRHLYRHPLLTEWTERSCNGWPKKLREQNFKKTGSLILGRTPPQHHSHLFELVSKSPNTVYTETDGLLDSSSYVSELAALARKQGALFQFHAEVERIERLGETWEVECRDSRKFYARILVNASGAWLSAVLERDLPELRLPVEAFARHLFLTQGWQAGFMPGDGPETHGFYWNEIEEWYLRAWGSDERLVSVCDKVSASLHDLIAMHRAKEEVAEKLIKALPEIASTLSIKSAWHCFRTYTEDQLPIIGRDPRVTDLFWLGAFGGFGMSTSFAATEDAANLIAGAPMELPFEFRPERLLEPIIKQKAAHSL